MFEKKIVMVNIANFTYLLRLEDVRWVKEDLLMGLITSFLDEIMDGWEDAFLNFNSNVRERERDSFCNFYYVQLRRFSSFA